MDILVIGGTRFVGRHIVAAALAEGHKVTLFHRGESGNDLFPECERILGNRDGGLDALPDKNWDAVVDTCGFHPRVVKQSVEKLNGKAGHYLFISTVNVYAEDNPRDKPVKEGGRLIRFDKMPESEEITGETYGGFKVLCEEELNRFTGRRTNVRPGLIAGPWDPRDRFTYWIERFMGKGRILIPGPPAADVQLIDARDLADFVVKLLEGQTEGDFTALGQFPAIPFLDMLHTVRMNTTGEVEPVSVDPKWLVEREVKPWWDLPLWVPAGEDGFHEFDTTKAMQAGLRPRPLAQTVREIAAWLTEHGPAKLWGGLERDREQELIAEWVNSR